MPFLYTTCITILDVYIKAWEQPRPRKLVSQTMQGPWKELQGWSKMNRPGNAAMQEKKFKLNHCLTINKPWIDVKPAP